MQTFYEVVCELLRAPHVACDADAWPSRWREVLRLRSLSDNHDPVPDDATSGHATRRATATRDEPVFVLEVFANRTRVIFATIKRHRLVRGSSIGSERRPAPRAGPGSDGREDADRDAPPRDAPRVGACDSAAPQGTDLDELAGAVIGNVDDVPGEGDGADVDDMDEGITITKVSRSVDVEDEEERREALSNDDALCGVVCESRPTEWTASEAPAEATEGFNVTTMCADPLQIRVQGDALYFRNPFYVQGSVYSRSKKRRETCYLSRLWCSSTRASRWPPVPASVGSSRRACTRRATSRPSSARCVPKHDPTFRSRSTS